MALIAQEDYLRGDGGESFHFRLIHSLMEKFSSAGFHLVYKTVEPECGIEWVMRELNPIALICNSYNPASFNRLSRRAIFFARATRQSAILYIRRKPPRCKELLIAYRRLSDSINISL